MTGREAVGCSQPGLQKRLLSAVKRSGAVSPATRARERSNPVRMPRIPAGMTTRTIVTHWGAPSASDASRRESGTRRRNSSVVRSATGIIRSPSATPPARVEKWPSGTTRSPYTVMPITIEGMPFRTSAA